MTNAKKMRSTSIKIDGQKLKLLLEKKSGLSIEELGEKYGYSRKFLPEACRVGVASSAVQSLAFYHGINKEEYELKEACEGVPALRDNAMLFGMTTSELESLMRQIIREELAAIIKQKEEEKREAALLSILETKGGETE